MLARPVFSQFPKSRASQATVPFRMIKVKISGDVLNSLRISLLTNGKLAED
jgi:hypothetical protein